MYVLRIYEWPTCSTTPCNSTETRYASVREAISELDRMPPHYWLAELHWDDCQGHVYPCGPNGEICFPPNFKGAFQRHGAHREHPLHVRLRMMWPALVEEVIQNQNDKLGLLHVACETLRRHLPECVGAVSDLAKAAYDKRTEFKNGETHISSVFTVPRRGSVPAVADVLRVMTDTGCTQDEAVVALGGVA
jgi:hypothetical protein